MKHFAFTPIVASLLLLFTGCSKDRNPSGGTGTLNIQLEMDDHIDLITRTATTKATPALTTFTLEVVQGEEIVENCRPSAQIPHPALLLLKETTRSKSTHNPLQRLSSICLYMVHPKISPSWRGRPRPLLWNASKPMQEL